ncbi:MAG: SAM-dependent methyltransferase [Gammaproteobacteria bacterium]|nr:SAM-dependent methyltransferase [Gammaproteobacteria bacterium]
MTLKDIIAQTIHDNNGAIGFDTFMDLALYCPSQGYYRSGSAIFGKHGDFITAPETSDLFGYCLAKQCAEIIAKSGNILEFGAGSGILASQILFELARLDSLPEKYYILELSGQLQQKQKDTISKVLPELADRVEWLSELPQNFSGVVIANEVLDAMPAKRVCYSQGDFFELVVGFDEDLFYWKMNDQPFDSPVTPLPSTCVEGYTTEVNQQALAWIDSLYETMNDGVVLLVDYGMTRSEYHHEQRIEGTLRCYYRHKASDNPFENIGHQDITTSVNFSDVAEQAVTSGFEISGYCTQAMFLISLGIDQYLLSAKDMERRSTLAQQVKQLVLPSAMGESFKVLALTKKQSVKLEGFKEQNLINKL